VIATIVTAFGTWFLRRWAAVSFLILTVIGTLSLVFPTPTANPSGLALNLLSCLVVVLAWRWLR
jgi:hypothetical protein